MAPWDLIFETADLVGQRALAATLPGTALASAYKGTLGGALYKEVANRAAGVLTGNSTASFPAGFGWGKLGGGTLPPVANVADDDEIHVECLDPAGPFTTIAAIKSQAEPP